jgi:hypothetical protein
MTTSGSTLETKMNDLKDIDISKKIDLSSFKLKDIQDKFNTTFSEEKMNDYLQQTINFGNNKIHSLLNFISSSVTDKFQNMLYEDLLIIAMKKNLAQDKIDDLKGLIQNLMDIVKNIFSPDFFGKLLEGLKEEYEKLKSVTDVNFLIDGKLIVDFDKYTNSITSSFQNIKNKIYDDIIKKAIAKNPKFELILNGISLSDIFNDYLKKMTQDLITSLPLISINMLTSIIPNPFFINLLDLIENYGNKSVQKISFLLLNQAANVVEKVSEVGEKVSKVGEQVGDQVGNQVSKVGGKKTRKYTKKYYLNRIHNTIRNFYKTNKSRFINR